jgi:hypothetical protein
MLADKYGTQDVPEVACAFVAGRRGPSRIYPRITPAA